MKRFLLICLWHALSFGQSVSLGVYDGLAPMAARVAAELEAEEMRRGVL